MTLLLEGKRAFVTGGTRGIGAAICDVFAREGADVAFSFWSREDLAAEVRNKIEAHHRRAASFKVSVTDRVGMKRLARELVEQWGGIDLLVNNAAINRGDNFATTTDRSWDEVIHTNVDSLFAVTKPIYKQRSVCCKCMLFGPRRAGSADRRNSRNLLPSWLVIATAL